MISGVVERQSSNWEIEMRALFVVLATFWCSQSEAARIFFSEVGPPIVLYPEEDEPFAVAPIPLLVGDVPRLFANVGDDLFLHVWLQPDDPPPNNRFSRIALDVESSVPPVAHASSFIWHNPLNRDVDRLRWDAPQVGRVGSPGNSQWIEDAFVFSVVSPGIGKRSGSNSPYAADMGRDANTGAFYLGRLNFRVDLPGATGLYFRNGAFRTVVFTPTGEIAAPLVYGGNTSPGYFGNVVGAGDPITPDLSLADAVLTVCGGAPAVEAALSAQTHDGMDTTSGDVRLIHAVPGEFRNGGDIFAGRINVVEFPGESSGDLIVYFDLVNDWQAPLLVENLNRATERNYEARLSTFRGTNRDSNADAAADLSVTFLDLGAPGSSYFIDFSFLAGDCAPGVPFPVRAVGVVPEPATVWLATSGLVATGILIGWRPGRLISLFHTRSHSKRRGRNGFAA